MPSRKYKKCHGNATGGGAQAVFSSMAAATYTYFPSTLCLIQIEMCAVNIKYSPHFEVFMSTKYEVFDYTLK